VNPRDRAKARIWHRVEFGLVVALLVVAAVGLGWSEVRNAAQLVETHPR